MTQTDKVIRDALHKKVLRDHHNDIDTLVLNELGLRHGLCRVDIAVVNGMLHGYEIKSDSDTLDRLPQQITVYSEVFDKVTLVVGEKYAEKTKDMVPNWWAIKIATTGTRGTVFEQFRRGKGNCDINPVALAELLWRPEAISILRALGTPEAVLRKPRPILYRYLADSVSTKELGRLVRITLKSRNDWRGQRPSLLDAD